MKRVWKILAVLFGLPLLLAAAWVLLNLRDVAAQPWPAALTPAPSTLDATRNLAVQLKTAPRPGPKALAWDCKPAECLPLWAAWLAQAENAGFIAACERLSAQPDWHLQTPVPTEFRPGTPMPAYRAVSQCHQVNLARALTASEGGDATGALRALQQADRIDRRLLADSPWLIGHMLAGSLWGQKLHVAMAMARRHPAQGAALQAVVKLEPALLRERTQAWMVTEASYERGALQSLKTAPDDGFCKTLTGEARWTCRFGPMFLQPNYAEGLMRERWLGALQALEQAGDLPTALPALQALLGPERTSTWWQRLLHTLPHWLDQMAPPTMTIYLQRQADLQLAAEATALWLQRDAQAWHQASPALRARLQGDAQQGWSLQPFNDRRLETPPLHWPPLS